MRKSPPNLKALMEFKRPKTKIFWKLNLLLKTTQFSVVHIHINAPKQLKQQDAETCD